MSRAFAEAARAAGDDCALWSRRTRTTTATSTPGTPDVAAVIEWLAGPAGGRP